MVTGSTDPFLPRLGPSFKVIVYKDVHYKMLTLFISLHLQAATQNVTLYKIVYTRCVNTQTRQISEVYFKAAGDLLFMMLN